MVTDTKRILRTDPGRPEVCNVCQLHRFFGDDFEEIWDGERTARTGCVDTKRLLAERIIRHYAPARERYLELLANPGEVEGILAMGRPPCAPWPRRRWPRSAGRWVSASVAPVPWTGAPAHARRPDEEGSMTLLISWSRRSPAPRALLVLGVVALALIVGSQIITAFTSSATSSWSSSSPG